MSKKRSRINTTLDEDLLKELKILAIEEGKKVNDLLEEAIKMYLIKRKEEEKEKE